MRTVVIVIGILAALGVGVFIFSKNKVQTQNPPAETSNETGTPISDGRYIEYSQGALEKNSDKRRVLFFYANWCPICRPADESFRKNSDRIPPDIIIIRINYNDTDTDKEEGALAAKYGVTYQHTFIQIDANGNAIAQWNGGEIEELLKNLK